MTFPTSEIMQSIMWSEEYVVMVTEYIFCLMVC